MKTGDITIDRAVKYEMPQFVPRAGPYSVRRGSAAQPA